MVARGRVSVSVGRLPTVADSPAVGDTRLMEYEPERTVPPSLHPPERTVGLGRAAETARWGVGTAWREACQMCLLVVELVCVTFSSSTSQVHVPLTLCQGGSYLERAQV